MSDSVQEIPGEVTRFHVSSRSRPDVLHVVDLLSLKINGQCSCENFTLRLMPMIKAGETNKNTTRCRHIKDARSFFLQKILTEYAARQKASNPNKPKWKNENND